MDFSRYNPPGVYTESIGGPQLGIQASTPTAVAIFGKARGYQTDLETIVIPSDNTGVAVATQTLRQKGIDPTSIVVTDLASGVVYVAQTITSPPNGDYSIIATTGPSGVTNGTDATYQLKRVITTGTMAALAQVQVSYNYTNAYYYLPQTIFDPSDIVNFYGPAFNASGAIISELTLAAQLAFINGASTVVTAAVQGSGTTANYKTALQTFEGLVNIAVVCCASGNATLFPAVRDHVVLQSATKNERKAVLGIDGSVTVVSSSTRITTAQSFQNSRVAIISPSTVQYYNAATSQLLTIGGQYLAAAVAGMAVSQSPALPLTRKQLSGFYAVDTAPDSQKSLETQGGLMVIDSNNSATALRIRHGVTTNPATLVSREWSILSQQDAMSYRLRAYFESDGLIGSIITDTTLANVKASTEAALAALVSDGIIADYQSLKVRQSLTAFDAIQITYEWLPSLPLNYVVVSFTLDVSTGATADSV